MSDLAAAIQWKYKGLAKAKCNLETEVIEEWSHPTDTKPDIQALLAEYEPVRLQLIQDEQDIEAIRNDPEIAALLNKRPSEIDDHFGQQSNLPSLAEQVALLTKQIKLLSQ